MIDNLTQVMSDYLDQMRKKNPSPKASNIDQHESNVDNQKNKELVKSQEEPEENIPSTSKTHYNENETVWDKDISPDIPETSIEKNGSKPKKTKKKLSDTKPETVPSKVRRSERKVKPIAKLRNDYISLD